MNTTAYNCKQCNRPVLKEQALKTFEKFGLVFCVECEGKEAERILAINQSVNGTDKQDVKPAPEINNKPQEKNQDVAADKKKKQDVAEDQAEEKKSKTPILDCIKDIVGNDLCQVFGDTGEGKSKFVNAVAIEAIQAGLKVFYLDTERNLGAHDIEMLGDHYQYTPKFSEMQKIVDDLGSYDLVIIDSVGLPVLNMYAKMKMNEQGKALLKLIAMMGDLKVWTYDNNSLVIVTNQPESEFNKAKGYERRPFGDKSLFNVKEVWKIKRNSTNGSTTKCTIESFRSRDLMKGTKIATMDISDSGVEIMMRGMKL